MKSLGPRAFRYEVFKEFDSQHVVWGIYFICVCTRMLRGSAKSLDTLPGRKLCSSGSDMCMYIYICTRADRCIDTHLYIHMCIHVCIHKYLYMCTYIHTYIYIHACMHAYVHTHMYAYTLKHTCIYVYVCACGHAVIRVCVCVCALFGYVHNEKARYQEGVLPESLDFVPHADEATEHLLLSGPKHCSAEEVRASLK